MGIFSEIAASDEAKTYEKIIREAIKTQDKAVILFTIDNIVPAYKDAKCEAWEKVDETLLNQLLS